MDTTLLLINTVGWIGMLLLVGAYSLVTAGVLPGTGRRFQLMNFVGGGFLMINSAYFGAWPSAVLNAIWVVIGAIGLLHAGVGRSVSLAVPPDSKDSP